LSLLCSKTIISKYFVRNNANAKECQFLPEGWDIDKETRIQGLKETEKRNIAMNVVKSGNFTLRSGHLQPMHQ
jgi:hypothetical protein